MYAVNVYRGSQKGYIPPLPSVEGVKKRGQAGVGDSGGEGAEYAEIGSLSDT
jgi:hypothetical protein